MYLLPPENFLMIPIDQLGWDCFNKGWWIQH